tara:strand:+ start:359 stop:571 length:213 start_codon:yes stop_codon:yes gene_type:complete
MNKKLREQIKKYELKQANKIYNYRTKTYMTSEEAWSCCCEDFMAYKYGIEDKPLCYIDTNSFGNQVLVSF